MKTLKQNYASKYGTMTDAELERELVAQKDVLSYEMRHGGYVEGHNARVNNIEARIGAIESLQALRQSERYTAQAVATGAMTKELAAMILDTMKENAYGK